MHIKSEAIPEKNYQLYSFGQELTLRAWRKRLMYDKYVSWEPYAQWVQEINSWKALMWSSNSTQGIVRFLLGFLGLQSGLTWNYQSCDQPFLTLVVLRHLGQQLQNYICIYDADSQFDDKMWHLGERISVKLITIKCHKRHTPWNPIQSIYIYIHLKKAISF